MREPLSFYHSLLGRAAGNQSWAYLTDYYLQPVGNTELAAFLKHNYFRFGSRYGWRDQLERATGQALDLRYLTE